MRATRLRRGVNALSVLLLALAPLSASAFTLGVRLKGSEPFCVYGVFWRLGEWASPVISRAPEKEYCTSKTPQKGSGWFFGEAQATVSVPLDDTKPLELSFRRKAEGAEQRVVFDLRGSLAAAPGARASGLRPQITERGVRLIILQSRVGPGPTDFRLDEVEIDMQEDN